MTFYALSQLIFIGHLLCACAALSTEHSVMIQFIISTFLNSYTQPVDSSSEMSFLVMSAQWEDGAGVQAQLLGPIPRWTPAHLASCCPLYHQRKITTLLETFTGSPLHERSHLSSSRRHSGALVRQPRPSPSFVSLPFHPVAPRLWSCPPLSDPSSTCFICTWYPFPFSTGQALTYPSRPRPNGTSSGKPSFAFPGKTHWIVLFPTVCLLPQETALYRVREHVQKPCRRREGCMSR